MDDTKNCVGVDVRKHPQPKLNHSGLLFVRNMLLIHAAQTGPIEFAGSDCGESWVRENLDRSGATPLLAVLCDKDVTLVKAWHDIVSAKT